MKSFQPYLKATVKGSPGIGVELFRLDTVNEEDLTPEEAEVAEEEKEEATGTAIMRVYEHIGEDFWTGGGITAKSFAEELDAFGDIKKLNLHVNSLGGDVFTAQAIRNIIIDHPAKRKRAYIDGIAASAATLICCGAQEVVARSNTNYMIHPPWCLAIGNEETMLKAARDLKATTTPIVNVYKEQVKGKIDEEKIRELMNDETWMTADEALEFGFVDVVRGKVKAIAKVNSFEILCSGRVMNIAKYHFQNIPKYPRASKSTVSPSEIIAAKIEPLEKKGKTMTKNDIDAALLMTIENEARTAERTRLAALSAMNPRNDPALAEIINKARDEGKQPGDIALECLAVAQKQLAAETTVRALARDAKSASGVAAGDAPISKLFTPKTPEQQAQSRFSASLAAAVKAQHPQHSQHPNGSTK